MPAKFEATSPCVVLVAPPTWAWEEMVLCEWRVAVGRWGRENFANGG